MNINHNYDFIGNINISERHFYSELQGVRTENLNEFLNLISNSFVVTLITFADVHTQFSQ